jgi:nucleotide-binding universal stress UspA family protein
MKNIVEPSESTLDTGELVGVHKDSFRRVVVPVGTFGSSDEALKVAKLVCRSAGGALRLVHVRTWDEHPPSGGRYFTETSEQATALLEKAVTGVWKEGLEASGIVLDANRPQAARAIVNEATTWGADVIVLTKPPRRFPNPLARHIWARMMRAARCPILVVRRSEK